MEIVGLPGKGFRVMIVKMIQDLRKRIIIAQAEKIQEMVNKEPES